MKLYLWPRGLEMPTWSHGFFIVLTKSVYRLPPLSVSQSENLAQLCGCTWLWGLHLEVLHLRLLKILTKKLYAAVISVQGDGSAAFQKIRGILGLDEYKIIWHGLREVWRWFWLWALAWWTRCVAMTSHESNRCGPLSVPCPGYHGSGSGFLCQPLKPRTVSLPRDTLHPFSLVR